MTPLTLNTSSSENNDKDMTSTVRSSDDAATLIALAQTHSIIDHKLVRLVTKLPEQSSSLEPSSEQTCSRHKPTEQSYTCKLPLDQPYVTQTTNTSPSNMQLCLKHKDVELVDKPTPFRLLAGILGCLQPVLGAVLGGRKSSCTTTISEDPNSANWHVPFESISDLHWLGSGAQGAVFRGVHNGEMVAVKKVKDIKETDIKHLRQLQHLNVVQFRGVCTQPPCFCIIMEYCPYGSLHDHLARGAEMVPHRLVDWVRQIATGMEFLHRHRIVHRDLKSPNILIGDNENLKISDFGTSRQCKNTSTRMSFAGTVAWMAPEIIRNEPCSEKVDVWSFGVVLWELLTCEVPYGGIDSSAIIWGVGSNALQLPVPAGCPDGFKLLIRQCWNAKPRNRPTFRHILMHLDIAAIELLSIPHDVYFSRQTAWKRQVRIRMQCIRRDRVNVRHGEDELIRKRREELRHAQDIREHYERKLERANNLYLELSACLLQLERQQRDVAATATTNCRHASADSQLQSAPEIRNASDGHLSQRKDVAPVNPIRSTSEIIHQCSSASNRNRDKKDRVILSVKINKNVKELKQAMAEPIAVHNKADLLSLRSGSSESNDSDSSNKGRWSRTRVPLPGRSRRLRHRLEQNVHSYSGEECSTGVSSDDVRSSSDRHCIPSRWQSTPPRRQKTRRRWSQTERLHDIFDMSKDHKLGDNCLRTKNLEQKYTNGHSDGDFDSNKLNNSILKFNSSESMNSPSSEHNSFSSESDRLPDSTDDEVARPPIRSQVQLQPPRSPVTHLPGHNQAVKPT